MFVTVNNHRLRREPNGFSIVELVVILGVIALLMGLTLPALQRVRTSSHQTFEMSGARQLMVAYAAYANMNRQQVVTGDPDGLNFRVYDRDAQPIGGGILEIAKRRYPWRLAPYLSFDMRALYNNMQRDMLEELEGDPLYKYKVAIFPSLGLNAQWVGGDFSSTGFASKDPQSLMTKTYGRFWVSSIAEVVQPDRLIVFASARGSDAVAGAASVVEGYFKVESPRFSAIQGSRWAERFDVNLQASDYGYLSPRYFNEAVIGFIDGHVGTRTPDQLRDMRLWANRATHEDWAIQANTTP